MKEDKLKIAGYHFNMGWGIFIEFYCERLEELKQTIIGTFMTDEATVENKGPEVIVGPSLELIQADDNQADTIQG